MVDTTSDVIDNVLARYVSNSAYAPAPQTDNTGYEWHSRNPDYSERAIDAISAATGVHPANVARYFTAPSALKQAYYGYHDPEQGLGQLMQRGAAYAASGFGYTPNPVSDYMYGTSEATTRDIAARRQQQDIEGGYGPADTNLPRLAGSMVSPVNVMAMRGGTAVGQLAGAMAPAAAIPARAAATGALYGASQPVYDTTNYASDKASQVLAPALKMGLYGTPYAGEAAAIHDIYPYAERAYNAFEQGDASKGLANTAYAGLNALGVPSLYGRASAMASNMAPASASIFLPAPRESNTTAKAIAMRKSGADPADIHAKTGVIFDADGVPKIEMLTHDAPLTLGNLKKGDETTVGTILQHDALYKAHPELKDVPVLLTSAVNDRGQAMHGLTSDHKGIALSLGNGSDPSYIKSALVAKLQQVIAAEHGFAGSNYHVYNNTIKAMDQASANAVSALKTAKDADVPAIQSYINYIDQNRAAYAHLTSTGARQLETLDDYWANVSKTRPTMLRAQGTVSSQDAKRYLGSELYNINTAAIANEANRIRSFSQPTTEFPLAAGQMHPLSKRPLNSVPMERQLVIPAPANNNPKNIVDFIRNWHATGGGMPIQPSTAVLKQAAE